MSYTGPDAHNTLIRHVRPSKGFHFEMRFHASVLHMRGDALTMQPFVSDNGDVLLWNGEIFDGLEVRELHVLTRAAFTPLTFSSSRLRRMRTTGKSSSTRFSVTAHPTSLPRSTTSKGPTPSSTIRHRPNASTSHEIL